MTPDQNLQESPTDAASTSLIAAVLDGLGAPTRTLPASMFYDERGSRLFDAITRLPEYYQTRTETAILRAVVPELARALGDDLELVEFGAGSATKTEILLQGLDVRRYLPIDVSAFYLETATSRLRERFPALVVEPIEANYGTEVSLGPVGAKTRVGFFPGGTIGNYHPAEAAGFLQRAAKSLGPGGAFVLGTDLRKDPNRLHHAYNDAAGVTAEFNLNILRHLNGACDADFDLDRWQHYALFDPKASRIEMHLACDSPQEVHVAGETFRFEAHETIWTESSYKYSESTLRALAAKGGFDVESVWTDEERLFSVSLLRVSH